MDHFDNDYWRYGSAQFADARDLAAAGMFEQRPGALFVGFFEGRALWYDDMGGLLLTAGARSGKMRDVLGYSLCSGICDQNMVALDLKGELAFVSQNQTPDRKFVITWNPAGLHGLPKHHINPLDYLRADSPSLVSDTKTLCRNTIAASGSPNAVFFEDRSREFKEAIALTVTDRDGVVTPPALYRAINHLPAGGDEWLNFAFLMSESRFEHVRRIEAEIAEARQDNSGGFRGILGELLKSIACLSDPLLMEAVSPPYTFSFADLVESDQRHQVYLMPPAEFVQNWAPVLKMIFVAGMIYKARCPQAGQQTWVLDEYTQLGAFPLIPQLFTYGAGIGIRPYASGQSRDQMNAVGKDAANIISSSAALQSYFAMRDLGTARTLSEMLGPQTLHYDDNQTQMRARHEANRAMHSFFDGDDLIGPAMDHAFHSDAAKMESKQQRLLRTPAELLNLPSGKQIIFTDRVKKPILADRAPYYEQRFMAGRYHPNPYHPPTDQTRIKTLFGHALKRIIREPVPAEFSHYPQYADGFWSRVQK